jgi:hypothetical protein
LKSYNNLNEWNGTEKRMNSVRAPEAIRLSKKLGVQIKISIQYINLKLGNPEKAP